MVFFFHLPFCPDLNDSNLKIWNLANLSTSVITSEMIGIIVIMQATKTV